MSCVRFQLFLVCTLTFLLLGCSTSIHEMEDDKADTEVIDHVTDKNKAAKQPEVSVSQSKESKPISENSATRIIENSNKDEIYIVPNRFPLQERMVQEKKHKQNEEQKKQNESNGDKVDNKGY